MDVEKVMPDEEKYLVRLKTTNSTYVKEYLVCLSQTVLFHLSPITYASTKDPAPLKESVEVLAKLEKFMEKEGENKQVIDHILKEISMSLEDSIKGLETWDVPSIAINKDTHHIPYIQQLNAIRAYFKQEPLTAEYFKKR